jgi:pheromone shutdown protein TraB
MSDADLLNAFTNFVNTSWMIFTAYVSVVFAYLVAGYLVSSKLGSNMALLVSTIYTLVATWAIFAINTNLQSISATAREIRRVVEEGESTLGWLPIVDIPDFLDTTMPVIVTFITVGAYVGSILFFYYQRNHNSESGT